MLVLRCALKPVGRKVFVDDTSASQVFPPTGGFSSTSDDWSLAVVRGPDGGPLAFSLGAGEHTVKLVNTDGHGMNLDYQAVVPAARLAAGCAALVR